MCSALRRRALTTAAVVALAATGLGALQGSADADIKGQASDPAYALEKMVLDVVRAKPTR